MTVWVVLAGGALALWSRHKLSRRKRMLRSVDLAPGSAPLLGHLRFAKELKAAQGHLIVADAAGRTRDGIVQFCLLGRSVVEICSPAAHAAVTKQQPFSPKPQWLYAVVNALGMRACAPSLLQLRSKEEHARVRSHLQAFFTRENVDTVYATLQAAVLRGCRDVLHGPHAQGGPGVPLDGFKLANRIVNSTVMQVFFESDLQVDADAFEDASQHISALLSNPLAIALITRGLHPQSGRYNRSWWKLRHTWEALVDEIWRRETSDHSCAFWSCLRRAFPDALTDDAQRESAVSNIVLVYAAGTETTVSGIALTLAALAANPDSMRRLEQELSEAGMLVTPERPDAALPTAESVKGLTYLNAVVHESLRCFPPGTNSGGRDLARDVHACGHTLPQGTTVVLHVWSLHYSKQAWGADAAEWRPERWLEGRSFNAVKRDASGHLRWAPFLHGAQNCLGQHLAMLEMKLAVAILVGRMRLSFDTAKAAPRSHSELVADCRAYFSLMLAGGLHLLAASRVGRAGAAA